MSIRQFLQERKSSFERRHEEVPCEIRSLANATQEADDEDEYSEEQNSDDEEDGNRRDDDDKSKGEGGPHINILHTACTIDNSWLVELQIKAGVDLNVVDNHSWTALMIAKAQGHYDCIKLLSKHMEEHKETIVANSTPKPLHPSGLVKADSRTYVKIGADNLTAGYGSWRTAWLHKRVQVRSNHPIPPTSPSFYYEVTILDSGPLEYVSRSPIDFFIII